MQVASEEPVYEDTKGTKPNPALSDQMDAPRWLALHEDDGRALVRLRGDVREGILEHIRSLASETPTAC